MFQVFIDNEEVVCESNFIIKEEFMNPSSIELYKVFPKSWKGTDKLLTDYYFPQDYIKCKIFKNGNLYFTGITKNSADMELNPFKPHYCSLQILDPSTLLSEGNTLDYVIVNKTVTESINQVIASVSEYGFVAGNINIPMESDTIIGAYSTMDKTAYDVFGYLSMISGTRWGTRMVDENTTAIDFYSPELLESMGNIEITQRYFKENRIESMNYNYSTSDYRNKQIMLSDRVYANIDTQETNISDGINKIFSVEYEIGKILSAKINNAEVIIATKEEKELGYTADIYYTVGEKSYETDSLCPYGTKIEITYTPFVKGRQIVYNNNEINRVTDNMGRRGVICRYETRNDVLSADELEKVGDSYIKFKGQAELTLNISSRNDFLTLGGKYYFNSPIADLKGYYLVKSKQISIFQNPDVLIEKYDYELTNSFDTENELNYFDNQRSKNEGNIVQGEYITRNIDIETPIHIIFSDLVIKDLMIDQDNALNNILDSPLNK